MFVGAIGEQCVIVTVTDRDNTNMGNRSYNLILEEVRETSSVPVEIYPTLSPSWSLTIISQVKINNIMAAVTDFILVFI